MANKTSPIVFQGIIEADETYIGGKPRKENKMNTYKYYRKNTRYRVSRSQYLGAQRADRTLEELEVAIIHVLLKNARENGQHAWMRPSDIGREIGTYRRDAPSSDDTFGRVHHKLLRKLRNECRVEHSKRIGWRLTEAEWNR